jgi:hypothetical protein
MVLIRFPDISAKRKALGYLAGRFPFKSWATGKMLIPEIALGELAVEGVTFTVEGHTQYEQQLPSFRNPPAA